MIHHQRLPSVTIHWQLQYYCSLAPTTWVQSTGAACSRTYNTVRVLILIVPTLRSEAHGKQEAKEQPKQTAEQASQRETTKKHYKATSLLLAFPEG